MDVHALMQQNEARAQGVACDAKLHKAALKHHKMGSRAAQWFLMPSYTAAIKHQLHAAATLQPTCRAQPCDLCKSLNCGAHYIWLVPYSMMLKQVC